jgi:Protein of unknown function (DUF1351)
MNEIKIKDSSVRVRTGSVSFPEYELLKEQAQSIADAITDVVVTEDNVKENKKLLANLNKSVAELEARRIDIKKRILEQYEVFAGQVKEIVSIVQHADNAVRNQVKTLEELERDRKEEEIGKIWELRIQHYTWGGMFKFTDFLEPQDLNKSVTMKKVEERMTAWLESRGKDLELIATLPDSSEVMVEYMRLLNLAEAMQTVNRRKTQERMVREVMGDAAEERVENRYMFIIENEKDANFVEILLKTNKIIYKKEVM